MKGRSEDKRRTFPFVISQLLAANDSVISFFPPFICLQSLFSCAKTRRAERRQRAGTSQVLTSVPSCHRPYQINLSSWLRLMLPVSGVGEQKIKFRSEQGSVRLPRSPFEWELVILPRNYEELTETYHDIFLLITSPAPSTVIIDPHHLQN